MNIQLSYQTQEVPPPYAFAATIAITDRNQTVEVVFEIEYLNREELSTEEIQNAGFSETDDFQWHGSIGSNWGIVLQTLDTISYTKSPTDDSYLHVQINDSDMGFPTNNQETLIQELIQAVFESAKREQPLKIEIFDSEKKGRTLEWSFGERAFKVDDQAFNWEESKQIMNLLYSLEFREQDVINHPVPNSVLFQDNGEWRKVEDDEVLIKLNAALEAIHSE